MRREVRQLDLDFGDQAGAVAFLIEELLHVPAILASTGVELQKDQVGRSHHGKKPIGRIVEGDPVEDVLLPSVLSDDQVNWNFAGAHETYDPSEWIGEVPFPDLEGRTLLGEPRPSVGP